MQIAGPAMERQGYREPRQPAGVTTASSDSSTQGATTRYFHIHEDDQLDEELVASRIKQASELPGDPLFW